MIKPMNRIEDDFAINLYAGYFFYYRKVYVLQTDNKPKPNQNIFFVKIILQFLNYTSTFAFGP